MRGACSPSSARAEVKRLAHLAENVQAAVLRLAERDAHDLFGDAGDLDVHLQRGDAALGAGDLEVHVAEMILVAEDVGEDREALLLLDQAHGDAGGRPLERHAGVHQRERRAAHRRHRRRAVGLHDLGHDPQRVGELVVRRQHRMDGPPRELAVTDFAPAGCADAAGLADREGREIVVQQERFFVGALQGVDELLVLAGAERRHHQRLGLAAREQRRAVRARQHADLGHDRTDGLHVAAVDPGARVENIPTHDLAFELLEDAGDLKLRIFRILRALGEEVAEHAVFGGLDRLVAFHLVGNRIGGAQLFFDQAEHLAFERSIVRQSKFARFLGGLLGETDDGFDHRLEVAVTEHHGAEHHVFRQLLCLRLDHQHRVLGAGDDEVELALRHFVDLWVEHVFVVDEADARGADRTHERRPGQRQRGGSGDHRNDVGIVLEVVRQHGHDHLGVAAPAVGEKRANRTVDQARRQRVLFGRSALAFEIAAGNPAGRVIFLGVVDGQRQEINAFLGLLGGDDGRDDRGVAVGGEHGAVGLAGDLAGF